MVTVSEFECRVTAHGRRQLELDVHYPVPVDRRTAGYSFDLFIFTPAQLSLTREKYGIRRFLEDTKSYTRHTRPGIPFSRLADLECEVSPLARIRKAISGTELGRDLDTGAVLYELRMLVNCHHSEIRAVRKLLAGQIRSRNGTPALAARLRSFLDELDPFLAGLRELHATFMDSRVPQSLREALRWADEAVSLKTEKETYRLHDILRERGDLDELLALVESRLGREDAHRASMGYSASVDPGSEAANEEFVYREGVLKKWAQGAMYMDAEPSRAAARAAHVLAGIAAAAAMAFAVAAVFLTERLFASYTVPWALLIVVAYVFKDRVKEVLRGVLTALVPRLVADQNERLVDPAAGRTVGSKRTRVRFRRPADLPEPVRRLRNVRGSPFRSILPPENVIHLHKETKLNCRRLMTYHTRLESITEILRLKLDSWLAEMDEPKETLACVVDGRRTEVPARRVYHVNLVLGLRRAPVCCRTGRRTGEAPVLFRYRLVVSRDGIERIERVGG
jgi:hypothetical protein